VPAVYPEELVLAVPCIFRAGRSPRGKRPQIPPDGTSSPYWGRTHPCTSIVIGLEREMMRREFTGLVGGAASPMGLRSLSRPLTPHGNSATAERPKLRIIEKSESHSDRECGSLN
jgi:hypothetical protein